MSESNTNVRAKDNRHALERLLRDDHGAVFLEFLIVLFAFMFILFGVAQVGLIAMASLFTNYANFMALRTAAVQQELKENGFINDTQFDLMCLNAAARALSPMEPFMYERQPSPSNLGSVADFGIARAKLLTRLRFDVEESSQQVNGRAQFLEGKLEYDYFCYVPFVGRVIAALGRGVDPPSNNRVMQNFVTVGPDFVGQIRGDVYPTLTIKSSDDLNNSSGSPPFPHRMIIQRRWLY